jgi:hypothetical protein
VQHSDHWTARLAAVRLLSRLRRVTNRVGQALRAAVNDVSVVQRAAYEAAGEFRLIQGDFLPELLQLLADPSAGVVAATTHLLVGIAKAESTSGDRKRILRGLEEAAARSVLPRPVHLVDETNFVMQIRFVDLLDRILYRGLFEVSGL